MRSYEKPKDAGRLLGKGYYTRVYENKKDPNGVFLMSCCTVKLASAEIGLNSEHKYFPEIEKTDWENHFCDHEDLLYRWYTSKKYLTGMSALRNFNEKAHNECVALMSLKKFNYSYRKPTLEAIATLEETNPVLFEVLQDAYYRLSNYSCSVGLDIALRNLACDTNGNLILLDIFVA